MKEKISQMLIYSFKSNKISEYLTGFIITQVLLNVMSRLSEIKKLFVDTIPFLNSIAAKLLMLFMDDHLKNLISSKSQETQNKLQKEGLTMFYFSFQFNFNNFSKIFFDKASILYFHGLKS